MNKFFTRLFHTGEGNPAHGVMDRAFVSEYTQFIDRFLAEHPEVLDDQHTGRLIYWEKKVDLAAQKEAEMDTVPDDGYGFHSAISSKSSH